MPYVTDGELTTGSKIDPANPPRHCGTALNVHKTPYGHWLVCHNDDYEIHTDQAGVLTEPPYITND